MNMDMKIMVFVLAVAAVLSSCGAGAGKDKDKDKARADSLQRVIDQKDNEINGVLQTFNDIQEGLRQIGEAEKRVTLARLGEGNAESKAQQMREQIEFIAQKMNENKELIAKLQQQLRESTVRGDELQRTMTALESQMREKDVELKHLRAELETKNIHIKELDETITTLNASVASLQTENERQEQAISQKDQAITQKDQTISQQGQAITQRDETINSQDKQINTAWYAFGTKKELKEQNVLVSGKVLHGNFNQSYFKRIDIRVTNEVKFYSKKVDILTAHPGGSYELIADSKGLLVLKITKPQLFWSLSKYLVVQVR